nr:clotting factor G beta subunit-like [Procambarus clarkii]
MGHWTDLLDLLKYRSEKRPDKVITRVLEECKDKPSEFLINHQYREEYHNHEQIYLLCGFPSSVLREVNVTVFQSSECDQSYSTLSYYPTIWPQGIGQETVCAGDRNGRRDACQGDSGGPIVTRNPYGRFTLAGLVSSGNECGLKGFPGLYVNLRHPPYLAWIKKVAFK